MYRSPHRGVPIHAPGSVPRYLPCTERACEHPGIRPRLALEHQARRRGQLGARRPRLAIIKDSFRRTEALAGGAAPSRGRRGNAAGACGAAGLGDAHGELGICAGTEAEGRATGEDRERGS